MSCPAVVKVSVSEGPAAIKTSVPGGPAVARVVTLGPKGPQGDPGASYYYQPRETVTAVNNVYTLDVTVAKEFVTAAAINGPATFNLSELSQIPADEVWRGVLRADYMSGLVDLGILGGNSSYAYGISADGSVVVGQADITGDSGYHAFRWTEASGIVDLGTLGGTYSSANALSADGSVVVGEAQIASGESRAFRWTQATGMVDLGTFGGNSSYAYGISADGSVVVGEAQIASGESRAFRWTQATGMVDLGTLGGTNSGAEGISADGSTVVGWAALLDGSTHAFRWTEASGIVDLGTLGGTYSSANALSADGSVVVGQADITGDSGYHAFRWTEASGIVDLGILGGTYSSANALSADGSVVVGYSFLTDNSGYHAFRWTQATGMVDLGTLGGTNSGAEGISADGSTIAGQANLPDGNTYAFIWKPINWFPANVADSYTIDWASGQSFIPNAGDQIALLIEAVGDENIIRVSEFYGEQKLPPVQSVNGKTGNVILKKEDIGGLQNVDNTSDNNKPISIATQAALDGKADATDPRFEDPRTPTTHKTSHATGGTDELTPGDIGAELAGAAATAVSNHEAAADPHPGYVQDADLTSALAAKVDTTDSRLFRIFIQNTNPNMTSPGLWIQTGLGSSGANITFWIEDGS